MCGCEEMMVMDEVVLVKCEKCGRKSRGYAECERCLRKMCITCAVFTEEPEVLCPECAERARLVKKAEDRVRSGVYKQKRRMLSARLMMLCPREVAGGEV